LTEFKAEALDVSGYPFSTWKSTLRFVSIDWASGLGGYQFSLTGSNGIWFGTSKWYSDDGSDAGIRDVEVRRVACPVPTATKRKNRKTLR